jgi:hypothetical protein
MKTDDFAAIRMQDNNPQKPGKEPPPNAPEKHIPVKPDKNPDPTKPQPGGNEPDKVDPTRIEEPEKTDPTRIASVWWSIL